MKNRYDEANQKNSFRALGESSQWVHAETAKKKTRKDRRESRFPMSLRSLRVDRMKSKIQDVKCTMQLAVAVPSLRALRETSQWVHAETAKGKSGKDRREGRFPMSLRAWLDFMLRAWEVDHKGRRFQLSLKNLENCEHHPGGDGMPVDGPVRRL
jgi:hypothetical protein